MCLPDVGVSSDDQPTATCVAGPGSSLCMTASISPPIRVEGNMLLCSVVVRKVTPTAKPVKGRCLQAAIHPHS
jgi:hypothetical protein